MEIGNWLFLSLIMPQVLMVSYHYLIPCPGDIFYKQNFQMLDTDKPGHRRMGHPKRRMEVTREKRKDRTQALSHSSMCLKAVYQYLLVVKQNLQTPTSFLVYLSSIFHYPPICLDSLSHLHTFDLSFSCAYSIIHILSICYQPGFFLCSRECVSIPSTFKKFMIQPPTHHRL